MKVKCIYNLGSDLRVYENKPLRPEQFGRFGASFYTDYQYLNIGKEYIVMGIITFETYQSYVIDNGEEVLCCPCQLFEVIENKIMPNWKFRLVDKNESIYPFVQSILGYPELCLDKNSYEQLIVENESSFKQIYFTRKKELENELGITKETT